MSKILREAMAPQDCKIREWGTHKCQLLPSLQGHIHDKGSNLDQDRRFQVLDEACYHRNVPDHCMYILANCKHHDKSIHLGKITNLERQRVQE